MSDQLPAPPPKSTLEDIRQYVKDHPTEWCPLRRQFIAPNHRDLIIIDNCQMLPPSDPPLTPEQHQSFQRLIDVFIQRTKASKIKFVFPLISHDQYH